MIQKTARNFLFFESKNDLLPAVQIPLAPKVREQFIKFSDGSVVELVDALDSKSSARKGVGVRFSPEPPNEESNPKWLLFLFVDPVVMSTSTEFDRNSRKLFRRESPEHAYGRVGRGQEAETFSPEPPFNFNKI